MNIDSNRTGSSNRASRPTAVSMLALAAVCGLPFVRSAEPTSEQAWRPLPLIADGKVDPGWMHVGWGGFVVDDGALRTECDPKGLGLLGFQVVITLEGDRITVDLDGQRITNFDSGSRDLPARKQWYEPKREPKRPEIGYIGLQNHDPGDIVWFKEVSIRPLPPATPK